MPQFAIDLSDRLRLGDESLEKHLHTLPVCLQAIEAIGESLAVDERLGLKVSPGVGQMQRKGIDLFAQLMHQLPQRGLAFSRDQQMFWKAFVEAWRDP